MLFNGLKSVLKTDNAYGLMVNTKAIYLSVLEVGLSLIAVNLPSLWFLFSKISKPQSFLGSVRSMASLCSYRSRGSSGRVNTRNREHSLYKNQNTTTTSEQSRLATDNANDKLVEAYAMHRKDEESPPPPLPEGKISVTDRVHQGSDFVLILLSMIRCWDVLILRRTRRQYTELHFQGACGCPE